MAVELTWLGHASFRLAGTATVYIDPWKLRDEPPADLILVSHSHHDHLSVADIARRTRDDTEVMAPADCLDGINVTAHRIAPGEQMTVDNVTVTGVAACNVDKHFHPRENGWVGFVIEMDGKRVYYAGDTDVIGEMGNLADIDLALLPVGGTYTMDAEEAARAAGTIAPARAVPYHWGDIVGTEADAEAFRSSASCKVTVLQPGESLTF